MFHKIDIKQEIIDNFDDNISKSIDKSMTIKRFDTYYNPCHGLSVGLNHEGLEPPRKLIKTRVDKLLDSMSTKASDGFNKSDDHWFKSEDKNMIKTKVERLLESMSTQANDSFKRFDDNWIKSENWKSFSPKKFDVRVDSNMNLDLRSCKSLHVTTQSFDIFLQELFSWNPEWLQGRAFTKPPLKKFEKQMVSIPFKVSCSREEYISRHLPFIQSELFIKLSDSFKNDAPSRSKYDIFINDCENSGGLDINKQLTCYSIRDLNTCSKPLTRINDIVILQVDVVSMVDKRVFTKLYFGVIIGYSMLELNELPQQVSQRFLGYQSKNQDSLLWDRYTIVTKRSRETSIISKQMARIEVILNAGFELKQAENLLYDNWKCTKLLSNIFSATGNIHQFSQTELADNESVKKTLCQNAIEMINKANPMVYFKGVNNVMVVDIEDEQQRLQFLCDIVAKTVESFYKNNGKIKFLVIAKNDEVCLWWRESLKRVSIQSHVKPWSVDNGRGWARHEDVRRYTKHNALRIYKSCVAKLSHLEESASSYKQLIDRRDSYQKVINSCNQFGSKSSIISSPSALIAKEELLQKGYENLLKDCNVIIGTFENIINCQLLFKETTQKKPSFDCCIVDDCQSLPDVNMLSIIHSGIKSLIIAGNSDGLAFCNNPNAANEKFNVSLFNRILMKCLKID